MTPFQEMPAAQLWPLDHFRRGHRLFVADTVAVSVDAVQVIARPVDDAGTAGTARSMTLAPSEIIRAQAGSAKPAQKEARLHV